MPFSRPGPGYSLGLNTLPHGPHSLAPVLPPGRPLPRATLQNAVPLPYSPHAFVCTVTPLPDSSILTGCVFLVPLNVDPSRPDWTSPWLTAARSCPEQGQASRYTHRLPAGHGQSPVTWSNCLTEQDPPSDTRLDFIRGRGSKRLEMNLRGHRCVPWDHFSSYHRSAPTQRTETGIHTFNRVPGDLTSAGTGTTDAVQPL